MKSIKIPDPYLTIFNFYFAIKSNRLRLTQTTGLETGYMNAAITC
jgi:hypothetical protein